MSTFLYCKSEDGGMSSFLVSDETELAARLFAWKSPSTFAEDDNLLDWMESAELGQYIHHRLGVMIRVDTQTD